MSARRRHRRQTLLSFTSVCVIHWETCLLMQDGIYVSDSCHVRHRLCDVHLPQSPPSLSPSLNIHREANHPRRVDETASAASLGPSVCAESSRRPTARMAPPPRLRQRSGAALGSLGGHSLACPLNAFTMPLKSLSYTASVSNFLKLLLIQLYG